ncbi:CLUMA_CG021657, isoform A [Clunio marinus]|uniref:CLUMA_CG021657, isoform A n=1 Tax=Clunio marinus TaxID=568069 RepID=A0A1J1JC24_9DIPT|nr:CLUMA_CG021657, isoform A [Clunio marinus]
MQMEIVSCKKSSQSDAALKSSLNGIKNDLDCFWKRRKGKCEKHSLLMCIVIVNSNYELLRKQ